MAGRDTWVFGYGSLMWDPGFPFLDRAPALLGGYHRAMCIYSHVWRGTPVTPGLVLGLDRGGACRGVAFRVAGEARRRVLDYLDARERVTDVYLRRAVAVRINDRRVIAQAYVVDRTHPQYAGKLDAEDAARLIRQGSGRGGANTQYFENAIRHLRELGVRDKALEGIARKLGVS
jgi:cation transport protein ChaC